MVRDVRSLWELIHHLVVTESNCRTTSVPLENGLTLHSAVLDQVYEVQHLPFESWNLLH